MPITAEELFLGSTKQIAKNPKETSEAEVPWVARGTNDEALAVVAVQDASPAVLRGMLRRSINLTERVNDQTLKYVVRYALPSASDQEKEHDGEDAAIFSFDTGGGTAHITNSLATEARTPATAEDLKGAIGWDGEHVQGVDIAVPVFTFGAEVSLPQEAVDGAYMRTLFDLTGTVNDGPFQLENGPLFSAGEVLFLGAAGSLAAPDQDGERRWKLTFRFSAFPNEVAAVVGDLAPMAKDGQDYLWVQYGEVMGAHASKFAKPVAAYVERVYKRTNFGQLALT